MLVSFKTAIPHPEFKAELVFSYDQIANGLDYLQKKNDNQLDSVQIFFLKKVQFNKLLLNIILKYFLL